MFSTNNLHYRFPPTVHVIVRPFIGRTPVEHTISLSQFVMGGSRETSLLPIENTHPFMPYQKVIPISVPPVLNPGGDPPMSI